MRDPDGALEARGNTLVRRVSNRAASRAFLLAPVAQQLVQDQKLIPYSQTTETEFEIERVDFVSAPFEWCDSQLKSAAELTLDISTRILLHGYELKDAASWNVIFDGCRPVFCDHLSFQAIASRQWWAFGQFLRHFVFPLQVSKTRGLSTAKVFRMSRDGLTAQETRQLLGLHRFFSRTWPLLLMSGAGRPAAVSKAATNDLASSPGFHGHLYGYCRWAMSGLGNSGGKSSLWIDYKDTRSHYEEDARNAKRATVSEWLDTTQPKRLIDVGANTGEFTSLAVEKGIRVVAIEQDHACATYIYQSNSNSKLVYPVLANLGDLCGGAGWSGTEHTSLVSRLRGYADMVLALAVIHHLAVSESIPLDMIADFIADTTRNHAIVEFIDETDPMLVSLAEQRKRQAQEFAMPLQMAAFARRFEFLAHQDLANGRRLVLMRKSSK